MTIMRGGESVVGVMLLLLFCFFLVKFSHGIVTFMRRQHSAYLGAFLFSFFPCFCRLRKELKAVGGSSWLGVASLEVACRTQCLGVGASKGDKWKDVIDL